MERPIREIISRYNPNAALEDAWTLPAAWYLDGRIAELEQCTVFSRQWQVVGRANQVEMPGQYVTAEIAGEPVVVVRGSDGVLRGFFNVCRHHAAAVMIEAEGRAEKLRCPYHGWTYSLEGELKGVPEFAGVCNFETGSAGLAPAPTLVWENWVLVRLDPSPDAVTRPDLRHLALGKLRWFERRRYDLECNWKVFVDNYLDGGYHVPSLHKDLAGVLDYSEYTVENGDSYCVQSSPVAQASAVRQGARAFYYWLYPNFMINWYEGVMDTNLVIPRGVDRTEVIFDFYFAGERNAESIELAEKIQEEDARICASVQRGLRSRAYEAGRLSVRREAGEHLFHRLLHGDLSKGFE